MVKGTITSIVGGNKEYSSKNASIREALAADIAKVNEAGIPRDIVFDFAW